MSWVRTFQYTFSLPYLQGRSVSKISEGTNDYALRGGGIDPSPPPHALALLTLMDLILNGVT